MQDIFEKNGDAEIFVDTEAATFESHWVAVTGCYKCHTREAFITLDDKAKIHGPKHKEDNNG